MAWIGVLMLLFLGELGLALILALLIIFFE